MAILYSYRCKCNRKWEKFKEIKERHLEVCDGCGRVAKLEITAPKVHSFAAYHYTNRNTTLHLLYHDQR